MRNKGIFLGLLFAGLSLYSCKDQPENIVEVTLPEEQQEQSVQFPNHQKA